MCECTVSMGRDGEHGTWCVSCGQKSLDVEVRPCGACAYYTKDPLSFSGAVGICRKHVMRVIESQNVRYEVSVGTCWSDSL